MKKTTKGALAAAAAGTLLVGGAGTLAFWTDASGVNAGSISSGKLTLTDVTCAANWSHTEDNSLVSLIVPGDSITKNCTGTLTLVGDHIGATVALDPASVSSLNGSLGSEVVATATMVSPSPTVHAAGTYPVSIDIDVDFPNTVDSVSSQNSTAALDELQLVATQTHE